MFDTIKRIANWIVLISSALYGLWAFGKLCLGIFIIGDNDTGLAMLSWFVFGLLPFPAALIAIRWRKTAALLFFIVAILAVAGFVDDDIYMAGRNGTGVDLRQSVMTGLRLVWPLLIFSAYYLTTGLLQWSTIRQSLALPQKET